MRKILSGVATVALAAALFFGVNGHVQAAPQCGDRDTIIQNLGEKYKEWTIARGLTHTGSMLEILSTQEDGGTWSIIVTIPEHTNEQGQKVPTTTCLFLSGDAFRILKNVDFTKLDPEA